MSGAGLSRDSPVAVDEDHGVFGGAAVVLADRLGLVLLQRVQRLGVGVLVARRSCGKRLGELLGEEPGERVARAPCLAAASEQAQVAARRDVMGETVGASPLSDQWPEERKQIRERDDEVHGIPADLGHVELEVARAPGGLVADVADPGRVEELVLVLDATGPRLPPRPHVSRPRAPSGAAAARAGRAADRPADRAGSACPGAQGAPDARGGADGTGQAWCLRMTGAAKSTHLPPCHPPPTKPPHAHTTQTVRIRHRPPVPTASAGTAATRWCASFRRTRSPCPLRARPAGTGANPDEPLRNRSSA